MPIDPNRPVFLKKTIIVPKSGNQLPPLPDRPYPPGTIPQQFLNDEYCSQEGIAPAPPPVPEVNLTPTSLPNDPTTTELRPNATETRNFQHPAPATGKINVNTASKEEISALDGIGDKLAQRVIEERKKTGFGNVGELNERVPIGFGRSWDTYAEAITF